MSLKFKGLPFAIAAAALVSACSDNAPTQASSSPVAPLSKGSSGGGKTSSGTQLIVTTAPTVNTTGTWTGTTDGPDVTHNYTYVLTQTSDGIVTGLGTITTPFQTVQEALVGTVNGDTLMLAVGILCNGCTYTPMYRGIVSSDALRIDGSFVSGGTPLTLYKQ